MTVEQAICRIERGGYRIHVRRYDHAVEVAAEDRTGGVRHAVTCVGRVGEDPRRLEACLRHALRTLVGVLRQGTLRAPPDVSRLVSELSGRGYLISVLRTGEGVEMVAVAGAESHDRFIARCFDGGGVSHLLAAASELARMVQSSETGAGPGQA